MSLEALLVLAAFAGLGLGAAVAAVLWLRRRRWLARVRRACGRVGPRYPVVLLHGLFGFDELALGPARVAYFRGLTGTIDQLGTEVHRLRVARTGRISLRARQLARRIEALDAKRVNLIAHSMGGLDARYLVTHLGARVLTLTTIGTPHRGTAFADWGLRHAERAGLTPWLRRQGIEHAAFADLGTGACARFNERTPDAPGVRYFSIAGEKPREAMLYALRYSQDVIAPAEGPNDGLVSVRSARWGESLDVWDCDHFNLVGWTGPRERFLGHDRDVRPLYTALVRRLAGLGF